MEPDQEQEQVWKSRVRWSGGLLVLAGVVLLMWLAFGGEAAGWQLWTGIGIGVAGLVMWSKTAAQKLVDLYAQYQSNRRGF